MEKRQTLVPAKPVREWAHELAFKISREQLARIKDIEEQCRKSGASYSREEKYATVAYLNRNYRINVSEGDVSFAESNEAVPLRDKILILHYFTRASGVPLTGKIITYKEVQEGINYYPTFFKRAIEPVLNNFKDQPQKLIDIARLLGGNKADYGDTAVTINAFPYVPLTVVLWQGDKEFPAEGNIMFDSTVQEYLPTEDITILCESIAWKLVRLLQTGGGSPGH
jgi:Domain of unknown function (DUF3786)